MATLTQAEALRLFEYRDGVLYWKVRAARRTQIGDAVGSKNTKKDPYLITSIKGVKYLIHKLVFLMHHGYIPSVVDHIDGNIANNKINNLREATKAQNRHNSKLNKNNTSGCKNVTWHKNDNSWHVTLRANGKQHSCGYFKDLELADLVAQEARDLYHGRFARHV